MTTLHGLTLAGWCQFKEMQCAWSNDGLLKRDQVVIVDYAKLSAAEIFAIEEQPQFDIDGMSYEARHGDPLRPGDRPVSGGQVVTLAPLAGNMTKYG